MAIRPDMIGIVVRDMGAALRFYRQLGLEIPEEQEGEPYVEVITPNGYRISWNTVEMIRSIDPEYREPSGYRMELAFLCDSPAHVDEVHGRLVEAGCRSKMAPLDAFWGQRYAIVYDPDDNPVSLFAALEQAEAP